jgi:hypothetical protein
MKLLITLILLTSLLSCKKEDVQKDNTIRNYKYLQGIWDNESDKSSLQFYPPMMYIINDTLKASCDWYVDNYMITIIYIHSNIRKEYKFAIEELTDSTLILVHDIEHFYKRRK